MRIPLNTVHDAGLTIRALRKHAGIRIDDFALTAQVSKQFMTDLENGKATVQMGKVLALLQGLGVKLVMELPDTASPALEAQRRRTQRQAAAKARAKPDA